LPPAFNAAYRHSSSLTLLLSLGVFVDGH